MQYFIMPIVCILYLEIIGSVIQSKLKLTFRYSSAIGFVSILACYYLMSFPFIYFGMHSDFLFIMGYILLGSLLVYSLINYRLIKFNMNWTTIVVVLFVSFQVYLAYNSTLGDTGWYDSTFYLNYVADTSVSESLNRINNITGNVGMVGSNYFFQSFYHLFANLFNLFKPLVELFNVDYYVMPMYMWCASTLFYYLLVTTCFNFIEKLKLERIAMIVVFLFICLFLGNQYWNNELAFIGNSYRIIYSSYIMYSIYRLLIEENRNYYVLLGLSILALCSSTSTGLFMTMILLFSYFVMMINRNEKVSLYLAVIALFPFMNLMLAVFGIKSSIVIISALLVMVFGMLYKPIYYLYKKYKLSIPTVAFVFVCLAILSFLVEGNSFNLELFFNNWSGKDDMTWNYFGIYNLYSIAINGTFWFLIILNYKRIIDSSFGKVILVMVVCFFNPLVIPIINYYFPVFYRAYDLFINPFTIAALLLLTSTTTIYFYSKYLLLIGLIIISSIQVVTPYDGSFVPTKDFNNLYRIRESELECILEVEKYMRDNNISELSVITDLYYLRSFIPEVRTLYGRNGSRIHSELEEELYKIFYPQAYYGDPNAPKDAQYDKIGEYLVQSDYKLIIQNNQKDLYNEDGDYYYPFTMLLNGVATKIYENGLYSIWEVGE